MTPSQLPVFDGSAFADDGATGMIHRSFLRGGGYSAADVRRSPVIGICTSWSEFNPCNAGLRAVAAAVKEGVRAAGGLALEFPTISLSEPFTRPSSMYLRNLMSMDVEEMIRALPIDGVVLLAGCDKTVPASLMGAVSADVPAVMVTAGPRPVACWEGKACTIDESWPMIAARRRGEVDDERWAAFEGAINPDIGTCNVLGTATTMSAVAEVLGFALPGSSLAEAASTERLHIGRRAGHAVVERVAAGVRPSSLVTAESIENAYRIVCALGGSTNALVHLQAISGRAGVRPALAEVDDWLRSTPFIADVRPAGRHLLSDLQAAGGVPAVVERLAAMLHLNTPTADGRAWAQVVSTVEPTDHPALRRVDAPLRDGGGLAIVRGSLAPSGAVIKVAASSSYLERHIGPAVVFDGVDDMRARIDSPDLVVSADSVLVLRGVGMIGGPGFPEVGAVPVPAKLARQGVTDMLRVTDARMSGTASGAVVLHVSPEAAAGGPLSLVRDGDSILLDVRAGRLDLLVTPAELSDRAASCAPVERANPHRGYARLHHEHALPPELGSDFDFLTFDGRDRRSDDA